MPVQTVLPDLKGMMTDSSYDVADPSCVKLELEQMDNKLIAATLKAVESGTLTPLIKEELRCTIQSRRLAEGKSEMKVEFKAPIKKKEMTEEERNRAVKRRQQNREAAQRFRQKQKDTCDYLSSKIKKLENSSKSLCDDLKRLQKERDLLKHMLEGHLLVCANPVAPLLPQNEVNVESTPSVSSHVSSCSSLNDCRSLMDNVPDTAASDSSVFFADDDPRLVNLEGVSVVPTFDCEDRVVDSLAYAEQCLDVEHEETICSVDDTDSEFDEERRPDSRSSVDTVGSKGAVSCAIDWSFLGESMRSVNAFDPRAHLESCSSQNFEPMEDDFSILNDVSP